MSTKIRVFRAVRTVPIPFCIARRSTLQRNTKAVVIPNADRQALKITRLCHY